jgi:1-aminocyclopropane-1-carboxylate deaminase/D-cysteine desulfhydrase-like pyridoxal-dependent ACC family enzyme
VQLQSQRGGRGKGCGIDVHLVIAGEEAGQNPLSREFLSAMGAHVHYVPECEDLAAEQRDLVSGLRADGQKVQELCPGGSDTIGTLGYIEAFAEILDRMTREDVLLDRVYVASGSAATQAGLVLGQAISHCDRMRIVGVAISQKTEVQTRRVVTLAAATSEMLGVDFDPSTVIVDDRYLGDAYPIPSADSRRAVEELARTDGLLFDPVYVGKVAAGLLAHARGGELDDTANVLLLHTGGNAGVYC